MKKIFLLAILSLAVVACERMDRKPNHPSETNVAPDNTAKNVRNHHSMTKTPLDQSESEADLKITKNIRQALINDDLLSINAKNIKVITANGVVTLRGPVGTIEEKNKIAQIVSTVNGITRVDNQLEVTQNN